MTTQEKQLEFWKQLKKEDPTLFQGTPAGEHYYELVHPECFPFKIRLDIYFIERDYTEKGYVTIRILMPKNQLKKITDQFKGRKKRISAVEADIICRNYDETCYIGDDPKKWDNAKQWFRENVNSIVTLLKKPIITELNMEPTKQPPTLLTVNDIQNMPIHEVQLIFWEQLKETNSALFKGTPGERQYYELVHPECLPFRIRLNIYCTRPHYEKKGFLTVRVLTKGNQIGEDLSRQLHEKNQDIENIIIENYPDILSNGIEYNDIICRNFNPAYQIIGGYPKNKDIVNGWFEKNVSMLVKELKKLAENVKK